jgi:hypothetical protein
VANGWVVVARLAGGGPVVRSFATGVRQFEFLAYAEAFRGGVTLAARDADSDGVTDIVTGPGPGGGPHVKAWRLAGPTVAREFMAFDPAFTGGVFVG